MAINGTSQQFNILTVALPLLWLGNYSQPLRNFRKDIQIAWNALQMNAKAEILLNINWYNPKSEALPFVTRTLLPLCFLVDPLSRTCIQHKTLLKCIFICIFQLTLDEYKQTTSHLLVVALHTSLFVLFLYAVLSSANEPWKIVYFPFKDFKLHRVKLRVVLSLFSDPPCEMF